MPLGSRLLRARPPFARSRGARALLVAPLVAALAGCGGSGGPPPAAPAEEAFAPLDYADGASWVCDATREGDPCLTADLSATELLPDGTTRVVPHARAEEPAYDCFYLHPTFAFDYATGNEPGFDRAERALDPVLQQAAPFTSECRVFAPRYRQIRLMTYVVDPAAERALERAYADVEAAFRHYLANDADGRPFVLMGHSQGAHMGRRLLERVVARDPALRERLVLALLLGGDVLVDSATGEATNTGGVPLCRDEVTRGCVIAYRTYAADHPPPPGQAPTYVAGVPEGQEPACNLPSVGGEPRMTFGGALIPTGARQNAYDPWPRNRPRVDTPFVLYRDFYEGECVEDARGFPYLAVSAPAREGDARTQRLPFDSVYYRPDILGTHLLDFGFAMADLRAMAERAAHAR